ncbi:MAG: prepilin-type N-terminal cleavage/methylation domain-containing protein [Vicinamibacteraceae bacterium]|nr:prepilin-type N-terminal cleavage/methylation domain-containing protein [Vicinamibacteraceae bacterium]
MQQRRLPPGRTDGGFSLIEAIVAMGILAVGVLALAQGFVLGLSHLSTSSANLVAREKAREAVESVHTARDTRTIPWDAIRNTGAGGVFVEGLQPLRAPGVDGLVNTADDLAAGLERQRLPGPDDQLGTPDDVFVPLDGFQRQIEILEFNPVNPDLREILVTIVYDVGNIRRTYRLRTFISSFS